MTQSDQHNVVQHLARAAEQRGERCALAVQDHRGRERVITFAELWQDVDRTSASLAAAGLKQGDRAIVMIPMSIELYVTLLAVVQAGSAAVFIDPWVGRRQIADFATFAGATAWLGVPKSHALRWMDSRTRRMPLPVSTGGRWMGLCGRYSLGQMKAGKPNNRHRVAPVTPEETAMITFTSGSSGLPKGVNRTHGFLNAQHRALQQEFSQQQDDVDMPMFPVFALNNLAAGVPSIVPAIDFRQVDQIDGGKVAAQMRQHGVTTCTASPPFLDRLADYCRQNADDNVTLRRILTGGAPVTSEQLKRWQQVWPETELQVVYGSTEAEPVAHIEATERLHCHADAQSTAGYCVGWPSGTVSVKVIRIHRGPVALGSSGWSDWELPPGEAGEIVVCGDHVAQSYFQNEEATLEHKIIASDGAVWHRMGDTGYLDASGKLWLVGRVHSTIWRSGQPVHPQLVERVAAEGLPAETKVAAVGLPDDVLGERVAVVIESPERGDVESVVRERIVAAGLPVDEIRFTQQPLPLDPRHRSKIDYGQLRERLGH